MANSQPTPWRDGYYKFNLRSTNAFKVTGESVEMETFLGKMDGELSKCKWEYGDFGQAHPELIKTTGRSNYNVEMAMMNGMWQLKGILCDDGLTISTWANELGVFEWITEDEYESIKSSGDPCDAPPNHYTIQPEYDGKLIFISGAPGMGKSTSGLMLSKMAGYVYYEADAFLKHVNPYIPPDVEEPSLATIKQKPLIGVPQERIDAVTYGLNDLIAMFKGEKYDKSKLEVYYTELCKNIKAEKNRIGGDWVVAHAVPSRGFRDFVKKQLGPRSIFIVLNMSREDVKQRLDNRHGNEQASAMWLSKIYDVFEPAADDEERTINIQVTNIMTREEVAQMIIDRLPK